MTNVLTYTKIEGGSTIHYKDFLHYCHVTENTQCRGITTEHMLVYVYSGELEVTSNGNTYHLRKGDAYILRRNHMNQKMTKPLPNGEAFEGIFLYLTRITLRRIMYQNHISLKGAEPYTRTSPYIPLPHHPFLENLFTSLLSYFQAKQFPCEQLMELKMQETVLTLIEINPSLRSLLFDFAPPVKIDLRDFMEQYYLQDLDLNGFAHYAGRSLASFKNDFQKVFQTSPGRWIISRRLKEAKRRIEQGEKPVDVYQQVGFKDLGHFSRAFKKEFGITPSLL